MCLLNINLGQTLIVPITEGCEIHCKQTTIKKKAPAKNICAIKLVVPPRQLSYHLGEIYSIKGESIHSLYAVMPAVISPCCRARRSPAGWRWRGGSCSSGPSGGLPPPRRCRSRPSSSGRWDPRWQRANRCRRKSLERSFNKSLKACRSAWKDYWIHVHL